MCRVAVVIPAYNRENYLGECLNSLIAQTHENWHAIVIDDGSSDGTLELARRYAEQDHRIEAHGFPNGRIAVARNRGLKMVPDDASYVMFLDSDDYLDPHALKTLTDVLNESPDAVGVYGLARGVDATGTPLITDVTEAFGFNRDVIANGKHRTVTDDRPTTFANLVVWICIETPGQVLIRTSAIRKTSGFDPETVPSEDWDMWLQLSMIGDFVFVRQFVMNKRAHASNISSDGKVMARAEPAIRNKLAKLTKLSSEQRRIARAGHRSSCAVKVDWARSDWRHGNRANAVRNVYRAYRSYVRFLKTWWHAEQNAADRNSA